MSAIFLLADTHFGHNGISSKFRKHFSSDEEHDELIFNNIMEVSGKRNDLFLLGDVCFKEELFWRIATISDYYRHVHIVLGNHDHKRLANFCMDRGVHVHGIIKRWKIWLSHAPIHPQELYRGNNIHGHVHNNSVKDDRYYNVSCENVEYKPKNLQEIRGKFNDCGKE